MHILSPFDTIYCSFLLKMRKDKGDLLNVFLLILR